MPSRLEQNFTWEEITDQQIALMKKAGISLNYKQFREYHLAREKQGQLFDYFLKGHCFKIYLKLRDDYDHFIVISGQEGTGKSTLAIKVCSWIDPDFNPSKICFTFSEILSAIKIAQPGSMILIDEGAIALYSRDAMTRVNKILTKIFMIMRAKCVGLAICIPNFHLLDSYVKDHRTNTLIQVTRRGNYTCYVRRAIKRISKLGYKFKDITGIKCASGTFWQGTFNKDFPKTISFDDYNKRKMTHMNKFIDELEQEDIIELEYLPSKMLANKLGYDVGSINQNIKSGKIKGCKVLGKWYVSREEYKNIIKALEK